MISLQEVSDDKKRFFVLCTILMLVLLSWSGILDRLSYEYLDNSFTNATVSYVTARTINAAVSVLQTVEVGVSAGVSASIQWGQVLDPINDMVERFSDLIVIAIGSIITQKILLAIISSMFFKVLITLSGLFLVASIYIKEKPFIKVLSKTFIFLVFLRLSISFMVLLNFAVDDSFLNNEITYNQEQIKDLGNDLSETQKNDYEKINTILEADIQSSILKIESLKNELVMQETELEKLNNNIEKLKASINTKEEKLSLVDRFNLMREDHNMDNLKNLLIKQESLATNLNERIDIIKNNIEDIDSNIEDIQDDIADNSDVDSKSFSGVYSTIKNIDMSNIKEKLDNKIGSILDLLILYVLKTILFPIIFMYLLLKAFRLVWGINLADFVKREYKTLKPEEASPVVIENK